MTNAEKIIRAVARLVSQNSNSTFSRKEVRDQIGVNHIEWMNGYTAIFQGMREDHPGRAPAVGERYKRVFRRVERGKYVLTNYGRELLRQLGNDRQSPSRSVV